jgi:hypothetical protein
MTSYQRRYTNSDMDTTTFVESLTMSDGSLMFTESAYSVAARAAMSRSLCFGGLSGMLLEAPTIEWTLNSFNSVQC